VVWEGGRVVVGCLGGVFSVWVGGGGVEGFDQINPLNELTSVT